MSSTEAPQEQRVRCDHCLLEINRKSAVTAEIRGETRYFCCHGCLGIYEIIHNSSLDAFYRQRCNWEPGAPRFSVTIGTAAFADTITCAGKENRIDILLSGIRCSSCIWLVEKYLTGIEGILQARVNYATHIASISWYPEKIDLAAILDAVNSLGYLPHPCRPGSASAFLLKEKQDLLLRFGTASFFSMQLMLISAALYAGFFQGIEERYKLAFQLISWALATPVVFYSGFPFISGAWRSITKASLNMDLLVALGSLSAYFYSIAMIILQGEVYFDTSAMIVTFILLGRFLEAGSRLKAGNAINELAELQPHEALLLGPDGERFLMPVADVKIGDHIEVIPGERVPLDGTVIEGEAEVNESMLTGESVAVLKSPGSKAFAGTYPLNGRMRIRVEGNAAETVLAGIIRTVRDAQARKAPIQGIADRTAGYFVPSTIVLAAATFIWWKVTSGNTVVSLMNAVSVLVIACPCALGLATPLAILVGTTAAGKKGILVKGGDIFETVSKTTHIVLDKTGTITEGAPAITDFLDFGTCSGLAVCAASLEAFSEHPAGRAIAASWNGEFLKTERFRAIAGKGVSAFIEETPWMAGSKSYLESEGVFFSREQETSAMELENQGKTVVRIACNAIPAGLIALIDDLRPEALRMIEGLRKRKLHLSILTGDNRGVAAYIASRCGITDVQAELAPQGKADVIKEMKKNGASVLMAGDGINDAPALTESDTGLTLGNATGIALECADVTILKNDLTLVNTLIDGSRKCFSVIRQNLVWAFSYNLIALPIAMSGLLHPIMSALFMAASSLFVVSNSLRLRNL
ncbi:MAG: heavy metal translocating P-type ATPase [Chlorobiaceae bacterium]|nr:heavy metal translocating P-type ATPase [Chlorobiaceae bacterium]NTV60467.1 heavy metal translocating P-type ATPase [Chlorobiaceae bacterium]